MRSRYGLVGSFGLYSRRITEPFLLSPHKTLPNRRVTASPRRVPAVMKEPRRGGPHSASASLGSRTFSTFISGCAGIAFGSSPCTCGVTASPAHTQAFNSLLFHVKAFLGAFRCVPLALKGKRKRFSSWVASKTCECPARLLLAAELGNAAFPPAWRRGHAAAEVPQPAGASAHPSPQPGVTLLCPETIFPLRPSLLPWPLLT